MGLFSLKTCFKHFQGQIEGKIQKIPLFLPLIIENHMDIINILYFQVTIYYRISEKSQTLHTLVTISVILRVLLDLSCCGHNYFHKFAANFEASLSTELIYVTYICQTPHVTQITSILDTRNWFDPNFQWFCCAINTVILLFFLHYSKNLKLHLALACFLGR